MTRHLPPCLLPAALALLTVASPAPLHAQRVPAVPKLDLNQITGTWFEQARLPFKWERRCVSDDTILFALNDKKHTFQRGTFCRVATGNADSHNDTGKLDKAGDGVLKLRHLVFFSTKLNVLAAAPDFSWAVLGTPNHKNLWLLTRTAKPTPAINAEMTRQAAAAGFNTSRLLPVTHLGTTFRAEQGTPTGQGPGQPVPDKALP